MDGDALEEIQNRVEAGEPLTEAQARILEATALSNPGPKWRLVIAHALINAERADAALPLMEALVRDAPKHPQTKLGLARALIALERFGDAERMLRERLGDSPTDPEALKALAVLALRRDERDLAKKLVTDALAQDPFDQEAQLIAAELDPASRTEVPPPEPVAIASERGFVEALREDLAARQVPFLQRGGQLFLKAEGHVGRVEVRGLYDSYVRETRPLEVVVKEIAKELAGAGQQPLGPMQLLERVHPVLRGAEFVQKATGSLSKQLSPGLQLFYVVDDPELVRYVPGNLSAKAGLGPEDIHQRAMANLGARSVELKRVRIDGAAVLPTGSSSPLVAIWEGDGYDGARLLLPEVRAQVLRALGTEEAWVNLGRRDVAIACARSDPEALRQLRKLAAADGLSGLFVLDGDGLRAAAE